MRKPRSACISIVNQIEGGKTVTSKARAEEMVERGYAVRISETKIRLLSDTEVRQKHALLSSLASDDQFWRDVARERGGENISFNWQPRVSGGFNVMQATVLVR